jgi:hypothetical protein
MTDLCRLKELEEVLGYLHCIEASPEGEIIALIGKIPVLLPAEMTEKLSGMIGRRVGILRLDGYRLRCLDHIENPIRLDRANAAINPWRETPSRTDEARTAKL